MKGHLEDITKESGSTKEILDFYIKAIKETPEDQGVLVLTYKEDGLDYVEQLQRVFVQAGIDINRRIVDAEGTTQPRLAFTTYGNHVGTNKFRCCTLQPVSLLESSSDIRQTSPVPCVERGSLLLARSILQRWTWSIKPWPPLMLSRR